LNVTLSVVCHAASESISVKGVSGRGIPRVSGAGGRRACGKGQGLQSRTFCKCNAKPRTILARINEWKLGWIWTHDLLAQPVKFISSHHWSRLYTGAYMQYDRRSSALSDIRSWRFTSLTTVLLL